MIGLNQIYFYHLILFLLLLIMTTHVDVWCIISLLLHIRMFFIVNSLLLNVLL